MDKHSLFTSNFKDNKLLLLLIKFTIVSLIILFFLSNVLPAFYDGYWGVVYDKINYLESVNGPRIILIGNSNLAFGMDSVMLEEHFNKPVINLGFHGAAGNSFHEKMIKGKLHEGDIVIICHTSYSDNGKVESSLLAWEALENHKELWYLPDRLDYVSLVDTFPTYLNHAIKRYSGDYNDFFVYSRKAFNVNGDNISERNYGEQKMDWSGGVSVPGINDTCINRLNALNTYANECGATLLVAGYPIADGEFTPKHQIYDEFEKELRNRLDCTVISHFSDYMIPYKYFYDTEYHLTNEGANLRTNLLISDLDKWMNESMN